MVKKCRDKLYFETKIRWFREEKNGQLEAFGWKHFLDYHIFSKKEVIFFHNILKELIDRLIEIEELNGSDTETQEAINKAIGKNNLKLSEPNQRLIGFPGLKNTVRSIDFPNDSETENVEESAGNDSTPNKNNSDNKSNKISQLENEIQDLKNQHSSNQTPEQRAANEEKIRQKEKELERLKNSKDKESNNDTQSQAEDRKFPTKLYSIGAIFICFLVAMIIIILKITKKILLGWKLIKL